MCGEDREKKKRGENRESIVSRGQTLFFPPARVEEIYFYSQVPWGSSRGWLVRLRESFGVVILFHTLLLLLLVVFATPILVRRI